jgi:hypothetical protein
MRHAVAEIYGLFSGRDGRIRYVGQTTYACEDRFKQHLRNPRNSGVHDWFHREWKDGFPIECVRLDTCADTARSAVERLWMARFSDLLNDRISGQTWLNGMYNKPLRIPEITAYMRRYLCNAGGFRGVRYDKNWDRFQVLMYRGDSAEWLYGDNCDELLPGWGGNMWFPDRTSAVLERNRIRERRLHCGLGVTWSPDIEHSADAA